METQGYKMETQVYRQGYKSDGVWVSENALHDGDGCPGGWVSIWAVRDDDTQVVSSWRFSACRCVVTFKYINYVGT